MRKSLILGYGIACVAGVKRGRGRGRGEFGYARVPEFPPPTLPLPLSLLTPAMRASDAKLTLKSTLHGYYILA